MRNIKLVIAYQGTHYLGWQKNSSGPSIEETLEKALATALQEKVFLQAASRTDAGVHARGQVVNFSTENTITFHRLLRSINQLLPPDIVVLSAEEMEPTFHPTLNAIGKEYLYSLCAQHIQMPHKREISWHFPYPLNIDEMRKGAELLVGKKDFSAFCNERALWDRDPVCDLQQITISADFTISIIGDHFLYKMARNIAGSLVYIGCGKLHAEDIPLILAKKERANAGITAPAHGLALKRVFYVETNK